MGKREETKKPKSPRDFYATIDPDAVKPLLPFVRGMAYAEPCYGQGDLVRLLGCDMCAWMSDVEPHFDIGDTYDATVIPLGLISHADVIITNPPFSKALLLSIMDHLLQSGKPLWLLLPADIMHNRYMSPYMLKCRTVLSIGRLCWFPDEATGKLVKGVDNYCWFEYVNYETPTTFHGR